MKASDVMHRKVVTVRPFQTLREVAAVFTENRITGAPVVDMSGKVVGVVSQTDLVRHERESEGGAAEIRGYWQGPHLDDMPQGFQLETPDYTRVAQVMTPVVFSAEEETPVADLARLMLRKRIHRIVITRRGRLAGIVSTFDLVRAMAGRRKAPRGAKAGRGAGQ